MNKVNVIKELDRLVGEMEPFFRYLKRGTVDAFRVELTVQDYRTLRALHSWTNALYRNEFKELKQCWALVPPEMWEQYKQHKIKGLQEQILLAAAINDWKRTWECRYAVDDAKVPESVPVDCGEQHVQDSARQDS